MRVCTESVYGWLRTLAVAAAKDRRGGDGHHDQAGTHEYGSTVYEVEGVKVKASKAANRDRCR
jgi:hypothetical protein